MPLPARIEQHVKVNSDNYIVGSFSTERNTHSLSFLLQTDRLLVVMAWFVHLRPPYVSRSAILGDSPATSSVTLDETRPSPSSISTLQIISRTRIDSHNFILADE